MNNFKSIIFLTCFITLFSIENAFANSINLVQMDVNKSSQDSVDVTFHTTSNIGNTVVTKKSPNKYVVLLPNTSSASSAIPIPTNLKDVINNIEVKNVNDSMGGYTKVTFETSKVINIKTSNKIVNPLTQAQIEAKALIAKSNIQQLPNIRPATNVTPSITKANQPKSNVKVENSTPKVTKEQPKQALSKVVETKIKSIENSIKETKTSQQPAKIISKNSIQTPAKTKVVDKPVEQLPTPVVKEVTPKVVTPIIGTVEDITKKEPKTNIEKDSVNLNSTDEKVRRMKNIPTKNLLIAGLGVLLGLILLLMPKKRAKKSINMVTIEDAQAIEDAKERLNAIRENSKLNWQEKYKLYNNEKKENNESVQNYIVNPNNSAKNNFVTTSLEKRVPKVIPDVEPDNILPVEQKIITELSQKKLKGFVSRKKTVRNSAGSKILSGKNVIDSKQILDSIDKEILNEIENGDKKMIKDRYQGTSLNEYFSKLDSDSSYLTSLNNMTNPISSSNNTKLKPLPTQEIISEHELSYNKSICLANIGNVSAIIGKVNNEIFILKKFDKVVADSIQVRPDGENVYIVKVGRYKCLVNVSETKMGTLLEI